jgi:hypothetical protein
VDLTGNLSLSFPSATLCTFYHQKSYSIISKRNYAIKIDIEPMDIYEMDISTNENMQTIFSGSCK